MNELALFAGAGGGILGGHLLGWRTVCAVERDAYAAQVLAQRQNDRALRPFPIWSDISSFDGRPWRGIVDVVSGGFPCQDISAAAGSKLVGIDGARSGLWSQMVRIASEVRPRLIYVENSPVLTSRGLGRVLGDLATLGFDAEWGVVSAADVGAPHLRERIWILAYSMRDGSQQPQATDELPCIGVRSSEACRVRRTEMSGAPESGRPNVQDAERQRFEQMVEPDAGRARSQGAAGSVGTSARGWWFAEPGMGRMADGVAHRVDRLKALGNGQVPRVAAAAFTALGQQFN